MIFRFLVKYLDKSFTSLLVQTKYDYGTIEVHNLSYFQLSQSFGSGHFLMLIRIQGAEKYGSDLDLEPWFFENSSTHFQIWPKMAVQHTLK